MYFAVVVEHDVEPLFVVKGQYSSKVPGVVARPVVSQSTAHKVISINTFLEVHHFLHF